MYMYWSGVWRRSSAGVTVARRTTAARRRRWMKRPLTLYSWYVSRLATVYVRRAVDCINLSCDTTPAPRRSSVYLAALSLSLSLCRVSRRAAE